MQGGLHAVAIEGGAGAEEGHPVSSRETPEHAPVGIVLRSEGTAVIETNGGASEQAADLAVPHDPTRGRKPVVSLAERFVCVAGGDIRVLARRQGRQQYAAVALDNRFWKPRGAARVQHPERMIERQPFRLEGIHLMPRP